MSTAGKTGSWRCLTLAEQLWSQRLFPAPALVAADYGRRFWACLLALAVLAGAILLPNRSFPLFEPDEGRRAEISREILANDDWVVCTLNQQPYYDKPPLFQWLVALSFCCFGTTEAAARLVPALATLLTILTTFVLGRRLIGHRAAFLGALALALMAGYAFAGRLVGLDGTLTLLVTAALLTAHESIQGGPLRWRWWLASAVLCGLGVLTKGPIALVLLLPPVLLHARLSAAACRPALAHILAYGAVVAAVVAPWVVLVLVRDPRMLYEFLVEHNIRRFATGIAHEEAWWYYFPVLAGACLPWSPLFPFFLRHLGRMEPENLERRCRPLGFLLLWALWCVLFFSLSRGKLPLYVMPALPALALLSGWFLEQLLWPAHETPGLSVVRRLLPRLVLPIIGTSWATGCYAAWQRGLPVGRLFVPVCLLTLVMLAASLVVKGRWAAPASWGLCLLLMLGADLDVGHRLEPALARSRAPLAASRELQRIAHSGQAAVACPGQMWASMTFACRGDIFDTDPATTEELLAFLGDHPCAFVILGKDQFETLRRQAAEAYRFTMVQETETGVVVLTERGPVDEKLLPAEQPR